MDIIDFFIYHIFEISVNSIRNKEAVWRSSVSASIGIAYNPGRVEEFEHICGKIVGCI